MFDLQTILNGGEDLSGVSGAVKLALEKHTRQASERLSEILVDLLTDAESTIRCHVLEIRGYRKRERELCKRLDAIGKAVDHLKATGNPLPFFKAANASYRANTFCSELGVTLPDDDDPLWTVPETH